MQEFPWVESGDTCSLGNGLLIFRILKFTLKIFPLQILNLVGQGFLALLVCIWGSPRCNDCSPPPPACSFLVNSLRIKPPFIAFRGWGGPILAINKYLDWWGRLLLYFLASLRNTYQHSFVGCLLKSRPRRICQECATKSSLRANSPIWASEASLARTHEQKKLQIVGETSVWSAKHQVVGVGSWLLLPISTPQSLCTFTFFHFFAFTEYKIQWWKKKKNEKRAFISPVREPSGSNTFKLTSKISWGIFCYSFFLLPCKAFSSFLTRCRRHTAHFLSITPCSRTTKLYCASQVPPGHFFRDFHKQSIKVCWRQWYTTINNDQRNIHSILSPCSYCPILFP